MLHLAFDLLLQDKVLEIFGHTDAKNKTDVVYVNYLSLVLRGINGLENYSPHSGKWKQAHAQARYVMTQVRTSISFH